MKNQPWKVFVPYELFNQSSSVLYGHVIPENQSVYVTASSVSLTLNRISELLEKIGYWTVDDKFEDDTSKQNGRFWILLYNDEHGNVCCEGYENGLVSLCTCVLYSPVEFMKSELLCQKAVHDVVCPDTITSLTKVLLDTNNSVVDKEKTRGLLLYTVPPHRRAYGASLITLLGFLVGAVYLPFSWMNFRTRRKPGMKSYAQKVFGISATLSQLDARAKMVNWLRQNKNKEPRSTSLCCMNVLVTQLVDSVLGVTLMYFLMSNNMAQNVANIGLAFGDQVAGELKVLLEWLMGAPAGLKLNSQLTHFLGGFFQYHIYLWTGYLYILKPMLGQLVYYCSVAGVWGLSVQLAMFQDIFSTMTIHIYCFYVYAARLYRLQLYALGSLWRLFRGKKWNVLRERVDSAVYDVDQLFVGTLLFTVLLFILPTTGLYYFVFTMLRVIVLTVQGLFTRARQLLSSLSWWYLLLWIGNSSVIRDRVVFQAISSAPVTAGICLVVSLQTTRSSFSEVQLLQSRPEESSVAADSWGTIIHNLFLGHLIYPWIERKNKVT